MVTLDVAYLLDFDEVGHVTVLVDTSLEIPSSRVSSRPSRNKYIGAILCLAPEVQLPDISVNHWHYPLLFHKYSV